MTENTIDRVEEYTVRAKEYDHIAQRVEPQYRPKYRMKAFTNRRMARKALDAIANPPKCDECDREVELLDNGLCPFCNLTFD